MRCGMPRSTHRFERAAPFASEIRTASFGRVLALLFASIGGASGASAQVADQGAATGQSTGLAVVVVTAQKREERLQNVPISIAVLDGADLDSAGSTDLLTSLAET